MSLIDSRRPDATGLPWRFAHEKTVEAVRVVGLCLAGLLATAATAAALAGPTRSDPARVPGASYRPVCPAGAAVRCRSMVRTDVSGLADDGMPNGFGPGDLRAAYDLPRGGAGVTVAITGSGGYSHAERDLATYRKAYGLPPCTVASGCLTLVNQDGQTSPLPGDNMAWWPEGALDIDMVSASCPLCKILYVESDNGSGLKGLLRSINTAVSLDAPIVTNSWGAYSKHPWLDKDYARYFHHPGHEILFASGDIGYRPAEPNSRYLVMVGSTSLRRASTGRGWTESVWHDSTSWCTPQDAAARWMPEVGCDGRLMVDVSTVGDPRTGVAVRVSGHWNVEGGTSASSPFVAGIYALGGHATSIKASKSLYAKPGAFYDVTKGSTGRCSPVIFCEAGKGYDAASGLGTPNGTAAFR